MAHPSSAGLSPAEVAFLCEMELVTVIPRERLAPIPLLAGATPALRPPYRADLPLWLALLLKRQRRASIAPPPWLTASALQQILDLESNDAKTGGGFTDAPPLPTSDTTSAAPAVSPPFVHSHTSSGAPDLLPYHWLEMGQLLLSGASDDIPDAEAVRRLLRDLREVRAAKVRASLGVLDAGAGVRMNGVGALEVCEARAFIGGIIDGLRRVGAAREAQARDEAEERAREGDQRNGAGGAGQDYDEDDDML